MSEENYRVLVADDQFLIRELICAVAETVGCAVDRASNGREVLGKLKDNSYALILMDCRMPGMDGYEATRAMRAGGDNTPIVGLTSSPLPEDREEGLGSGMNEFMQKPFTTDMLEGLMQQYPAHDH